MPIGRSLEKKRLEEELKKIMSSNAILEYKRQACGQLLFKHAKRYSYCDSNIIMGTIQGYKELNLTFPCPAIDRLNRKR